MRAFIFLLLLAVSGCATFVYTDKDLERMYGPSAPKQRLIERGANLPPRAVSFQRDVKPILDSRCVVCHGCYDAPCQLKLGSIDGIDRGASKQLVYDFARLKPAEPTRLFVDATNTQDWRKKSFFPILNERDDSDVANVENSVLAKLLQLKRLNPQPAYGRLDKRFDFEFDRALQCPSMEEFPKYQREHPHWGMPYAMPGLTLKEERTLMQWLEEGAKVEALPPLPKRTNADISKWENYFNSSDIKQKLVSRYIYEHLFIGHIHFIGHPANEFFNLVRSKTPSGQAIEEINTVRPYDDPGIQPFYYRFRQVTETIVDKTHFVYELSDQKIQRYNELFLKPEYQVTALPGYEPKVASNPFKAFVDLPLPSRYQFLLDDAEYFVSGFIKGPVCRGKVATESIRDRFWILFVEPTHLFPQKISKALAENNELLELPGGQADSIGLFDWVKYDAAGKKYLKDKDDFINSVLPKDRGFGLENIWDGDGYNPNAALTVFRHFNSATVTQGLIGDTPLTGWIVDYPIFERLHYLLVAGFNIYGTAAHQLASRTYMDILRQDGEDNFLRLMPAKERLAIYDSWYQGSSSFRVADPLFSIEHESEVKYQTTDYKKEFFVQVRQKLGKLAGKADPINRCEQEPCISLNASPAQQQIEQQLRSLATTKGMALSNLPEISLLRINTGDPNKDQVYTLLVNRAFSNLSKMISIASKRIPEQDTLTVTPGFIGSYPNFFFNVPKARLTEFVNALRNAKNEADTEVIYTNFGIRRSNNDIWQQSDWFNQQHLKSRGLQAGLLDMSRYENL